jgi:small-conductance mechanosensitive channel
MLETFDLTKTTQILIAWWNDAVWTPETAYQIILIIGAFIIGRILYRLTRAPIENGIEKFSTLLKFQPRLKSITQNIQKLAFPIYTALIMMIGAYIIGSESLNVPTQLPLTISKVLMAWVVIRIAVQFIENAAMRNFFALIIWSIAALSIFGVLDDTSAALESFAFSVGEFRLSALAVIKSLLLLFGLLYFALFLSGVGERRVKKIKGLTRSSQVLISKIMRVTLIVFAIIIGLTSAGIDLSLFAVFGGAIGLGIGFGLQKGISNLFSGMLLLMDQSIKPGDVIELPDIGTFGWVNRMAARYTEIVTRDNKSFLIPNEDFITQRVVNWSHGNSLIRIQVNFGVHYNSDPHLVKEIAEKAATAPERVVDTPSPVCWLVDFGDSSLDFSLRFWIKDAEAGVTNIRGMVMMALWDAFKEHDIEIPYPHREVYIHESPKT